MQNEYNWLYENDKYKVYAILDNVYLKDKTKCQFHNKYEKTDKHLAWIYGNPTGAIIMPDNDFAVIVGCGITIYNIKEDTVEDYYNDPEDIWWIQAVFQVNHMDNWKKELRVVTYNEEDKTRVFKFNIETKELIEIE